MVLKALIKRLERHSGPPLTEGSARFYRRPLCHERSPADNPGGLYSDGARAIPTRRAGQGNAGGPLLVRLMLGKWWDHGRSAD